MAEELRTQAELTFVSSEARSHYKPLWDPALFQIKLRSVEKYKCMTMHDIIQG